MKKSRTDVLAKMRDIFRRIWRQVYHSTKALLPTTSADERTRSSWAKAIETYQAVPEVYKDFFAPYLAEGRAFPYTILTPSYEGFIHRSTEKLVCDFEHEIWILERIGNTYAAQCYPIEGISYVEVRTVLLDSRIKITSVTKPGVPASSTIRFNSVTDYLLMPFVERIRLAAIDSKSATAQSEMEKFDHWVRLNYKFMSYARRSLLGGEKVVQAILQPEIRAKVLAILGRTYHRTIFPTHVSILTDRELILIREEERYGGEDKYGGIWDYVPLNKIKQLSSREKDSNMLVLSIELPESVRLEYLFQASAKGEIDQMLDQFKELTRR